MAADARRRVICHSRCAADFILSYNGILSGALDLTGAAASVEAVTVPPSATTADLMYTLTVDLNNHYRIWVEAGLLRFERDLQRHEPHLRAHPA